MHHVAQGERSEEDRHRRDDAIDGASRISIAERIRRDDQPDAEHQVERLCPHRFTETRPFIPGLSRGMNGLPLAKQRTCVLYYQQARRPHSLGRRAPRTNHHMGARGTGAPGPAGHRQGGTGAGAGLARPGDGPLETALGRCKPPRPVTRCSRRRKHLQESRAESPAGMRGSPNSSRSIPRPTPLSFAAEDPRSAPVEPATAAALR
jgi:hypothetical protein